MWKEIITLSLAFLLLGIIIGRIIFGKTGLGEWWSNRRVINIIQNPNKLIEKLNANGTIVDMGEQVSFKVGENDKGKKILEISRKPAKTETDRESKPKKK